MKFAGDSDYLLGRKPILEGRGVLLKTIRILKVLADGIMNMFKNFYQKYFERMLEVV